MDIKIQNASLRTKDELIINLATELLLYSASSFKGTSYTPEDFSITMAKSPCPNVGFHLSPSSYEFSRGVLDIATNFLEDRGLFTPNFLGVENLTSILNAFGQIHEEFHSRKLFDGMTRSESAERRLEDDVKAVQTLLQKYPFQNAIYLFNQSTDDFTYRKMTVQSLCDIAEEQDVLESSEKPCWHLLYDAMKHLDMRVYNKRDKSNEILQKIYTRAYKRLTDEQKTTLNQLYQMTHGVGEGDYNIKQIRRSFLLWDDGTRNRVYNETPHSNDQKLEGIHSNKLDELKQ